MLDLFNSIVTIDGREYLPMSAVNRWREDIFKAYPPKHGYERYYLAFDIPAEADPISAQLDFKAPDGYQVTELYQPDINLQTAIIQGVPRGRISDRADDPIVQKYLRYPTDPSSGSDSRREA